MYEILRGASLSTYVKRVNILLGALRGTWGETLPLPQLEKKGWGQLPLELLKAFELLV
jgi:hypothetical protein